MTPKRNYIAYRSLSITLSCLCIYSLSHAQTTTVSPQERSFEIFVAILGVLLSVCGFLAVFVLNAMWGTQKQIHQILMNTVTRIEVLEQVMRDTRKDVEENKNEIGKTVEKLEHLCKREDCPMKNNRTAHF